MFGSGLEGNASCKGFNSQKFSRYKLYIDTFIFATAIIFGLLLPVHSIAATQQEIVELRTEDSKTFKNVDGSTTVEFSTEPLHYLDEVGTWQDIDTSIMSSNPISTSNTLFSVSSTPYPQYSVTKNTYKAYFGGTLAEPIRLEWKNKGVEFYPLNFATPLVSVEKDVITYLDAWKEADLKYTTTPRQLKEQVILKSVRASTTYSFLVKSNDVTLIKETDGSIGMYDAIQGGKLWSLPAPFMYDSAQQPVYSDAAKFELNQQGNDYYLDIVLDPGWLSAPERVYPVVVDPTMYLTLGAGSVEYTDPDLDVLTYRYTVRDETTGQVVAAQTINPLITGLVHGHAYSWSVTVEDGYTSVTSNPAQFAVDLAAPEITLDNLSDTYAQSQSITVTAQDSTSGLASLEYRWNAEAYQALPSGQVLSAPHGKNTLSVRARDIAGNVQNGWTKME